LSNGSINKTLKVLAQITDTAIEYGYAQTNPARGKRRRLKAPKPRRTWLEIDEARALLEAAREDRTLLATMMLAACASARPRRSDGRTSTSPAASCVFAPQRPTPASAKSTCPPISSKS
jgi:hypothetical protein